MNGKGVRQEVKKLMARHKIYRNDDKALVIKVWENHGLELTPHQKFMFLQAPGADVILRRRREFSPQYPATPEVTEKRYKHFTELSEEFSRVRYHKFPERAKSLWNRLRRKHGS